MSTAPATGLEGRAAAGRTALLVIDMQNDFCAEGGYVERVVGRDATPCRAIIPALDGLIGAARAAAVPVVWVVADYSLDRIPAPARLRLAERDSTEACCAPGSWGGDFFGVRPAAEEKLFVKHSYSAFHETGLDVYLRARDIATLVVAGVQTNICIDYAIRDGFVRGFNIVVPEDCVASHTLPLHEATLANVRFLLGDVVPSARLRDIWTATR